MLPIFAEIRHLLVIHLCFKPLKTAVAALATGALHNYCSGSEHLDNMRQDLQSGFCVRN